MRSIHAPVLVAPREIGWELDVFEQFVRGGGALGLVATPDDAHRLHLRAREELRLVRGFARRIRERECGEREGEDGHLRIKSEDGVENQE